MSIDQKISQAWQDAAAELNIRVFAPHQIDLGKQCVDVEVFLPDFGGPDGTVGVGKANSDFLDQLKSRHWLSVLYESYRTFDRTLFIDTLNDWGWFGSGAPPEWFTGKPWS